MNIFDFGKLLLVQAKAPTELGDPGRAPLPAPPGWRRVPGAMAVARKKPRIQASEVDVGSRTLESVLRDLAEQVKDCAERSARAEERSARAEERSARAEERSAQAAERSAQTEERLVMALQTIGAVAKDLMALAGRTDGRLNALEKTAGA